MKKKFVRGQWLSAKGLLTIEGIVASTVVEGSMKRDGFLQFIEIQVVRVSSDRKSGPVRLFCPWVP
jgi:hypothetical protein